MQIGRSPNRHSSGDSRTLQRRKRCLDRFHSQDKTPAPIFLRVLTVSTVAKRGIQFVKREGNAHEISQRQVHSESARKVLQTQRKEKRLRESGRFGGGVFGGAYYIWRTNEADCCSTQDEAAIVKKWVSVSTRFRLTSACLALPILGAGGVNYSGASIHLSNCGLVRDFLALLRHPP